MVSGLSTPEMTAGLPLYGEDRAVRAVAEAEVQAAKSISIEGVSVSYALGRAARRSVLENISIEIEEGEFVVLLGETGCGKSTLLRVLLGQERPTAGQISVAGSRVQRVDARSGALLAVSGSDSVGQLDDGAIDFEVSHSWKAAAKLLGDAARGAGRGVPTTYAYGIAGFRCWEVSVPVVGRDAAASRDCAGADDEESGAADG
jgi:energy-coupling factor transporter ATP-binding protein EcfA2